MKYVGSSKLKLCEIQSNFYVKSCFIYFCHLLQYLDSNFPHKLLHLYQCSMLISNLYSVCYKFISIYKQFIRLQDMQSSESQQCKILSEKVAFEQKWLGITNIGYSIGGKVLQNYEAAYRPTRAKTLLSIDGVQIIPILKKQDSTLELIMIANFRPPIGKFCLEFPAGMVDDSNFQENALRELREETGYIASKILKIPSIMMNCDPWKSSQGGYMYVGIINESDPNHKIKQQLEFSQNIRVLYFKIEEDLPQKIDQFLQTNNFGINTKLWTFIIGLSYHRLFVK